MTQKEVIADQENIALFRKRERLDLSENGMFERPGLAMTFSTHLALKAKPKRRTPGPINMDSRAEYDVKDYFEIIEGNDQIPLDLRAFYLFGTRKEISLGDVCGLLSREARETGTGLWGHFAGVFQPFWRGEITMECRSESPRVIREGDPAGYVKFDKIRGAKRIVEGSYLDQRAPLAPKMFKPVS